MSGTDPIFTAPGHDVRAWIFDLDGTLLDTLDDLTDSINVMLDSRGLPPRTRDEVCAGVGDGMFQLVERMLPEGVRDPANVTAALADYRAAYRDRWHLKTRPYPGVAEDLVRLTAEGVALGVVSNKPQDFTARIIAHFFPAPDYQFGVVFGEREGIARKPDPAGLIEAAGVLGVPPQACAYVGDSPGDIIAAKRAGMLAVGVDWGFRDPGSLMEAGTDLVLTRPSPAG